MGIVIGVDEVGTGSWVGPAYVGAVAIHVEELPALRDQGMRDSKKMSRQSRAYVAGLIHEAALSVVLVEIPKTSLERDFSGAWDGALVEAVRRSALDLPGVEAITIDGVFKKGVHNQLRHFGPITFCVKGDDKIPEVSAASVVAKVHRSSLLVELSRTEPWYRWDVNDGYPTPDHIRAIRKHGLSQHHRVNAGTQRLGDELRAQGDDT